MPLDFLVNSFADASTASNVMRGYVTPAIATLCGFAGLASVLFLVIGGVRYISSTGHPEKISQAKKIIKNALIGLILVLSASALTAILVHSYNTGGSTLPENVPTISAIEQPRSNLSIFDVVIKAVIKFLETIVESSAQPFLNAISYFIKSTPLMGNNSSVFNLWLAVVGIADVLFILVIALLGFQVMSYTALGLDEIEIKHLLPQFALIFLLMNTSIFAIDAVISLSNAMINALQSGFMSTDIWKLLATLTEDSNKLGLVGLLMMVGLLVLTIMLLIYYVLRMVALYIGAVLAPLIAMLWLLPAFKDFAVQALKTYLTLIFVLFVHAVIMLLAASIFVGANQVGDNGQPNTLMALIVGMATVIALLKTQGVMQQLSYAASAPRAARELTSSFVRSASAVRRTARGSMKSSGTSNQAKLRPRNFLSSKPTRISIDRSPTANTKSSGSAPKSRASEHMTPTPKRTQSRKDNT